MLQLTAPDKIQKCMHSQRIATDVLLQNIANKTRRPICQQNGAKVTSKNPTPVPDQQPPPLCPALTQCWWY